MSLVGRDIAVIFPTSVFGAEKVKDTEDFAYYPSIFDVEYLEMCSRRQTQTRILQQSAK